MPCRSCSWGLSVQGQQPAHNSSHCLGMAGGGGAPAHPQGDPPPRVVGGLSLPLAPVVPAQPAPSCTSSLTAASFSSLCSN